MGFLDSIFYKSAKPVAGRDTIARAVSGGTSKWATASSYGVTSWDMDRALSHAYDRVVWVFRCVHVVASKQASLTMQLKDTTTAQGKVIDDKDFHRLLNRKANPYEDAWKFRYRLSAQMLLSPLGAFIEVVKSPAGKIVELYLLDPGSVEPIKSDKKWVSGYKVKRADGTKDELDPEGIIWVMNFPHPTDPYRNVTPLESAGISVETDWFARLYNMNFLRNDGRPGMLIGIDADMTSEDAQELRSMFSGGYNRAGETRVVDAKGLSVVDLTIRPRDSQWGEAINSSKENILTAFGVPESVLGNSAGRCLRASENVFLANGEVKRAEELVGQTFHLLQPFKGDIRAIVAKADYAKKEKIFKITTFSGRTLETNGEHPLYMAASANQGPFKRDIFPHGWVDMKSIKAHFDRHDRHNTSYADGSLHTEVAIPIQFPAIDAIDQDADDCWDIGEDGETVPDLLFTADEESQRAYLSALYTKHGRLSQHTAFDIYAPNVEFATRLQRLLQRIGVVGVVTTKKMRHTVSISGKINMFNFLSQIDLKDKAADRAKAVWERLQSDTSREQNSFRSDGLPAGFVWDRIYSVEEIGEDQTVAITTNEGDHSYLSMFWEHNTFDNAEQEVEEFWTGTMMTHCEAISRALEPLTEDEDDNIFVSFRYEDVDVLQRAQRRKEDNYKQQFLTGAITLDDLRIALGEDPLDMPHTRVLYLTNGVIVGTPEDVAIVRQSQLNPQQLGIGAGGVDPMQNPFTAGTTGGNGVIGGVNDTVQGELAAAGSPQATQTVNDNAARTLRSAGVNGSTPLAVNPNANVDVYERIDSMTRKNYVVNQVDTKTDVHRDLRNRMFGFLEGSLDSWSDRQLNVVSDRLVHAKVRKGTRHWDGDAGTKALDTDYLVDKPSWNYDITTTVTDFMRQTITKAAWAEVNRLRDAGFKVADPDAVVLETVAAHPSNTLSSSAARQTYLLAKHIGVLDADFKSIQEIQSTLRPDSFDRERWIAQLAKKTTTYALESLYNYIYGTLVEGKAYKIWHTGPDETGRLGHANLEGKLKHIADTYEIGEEKLRFPTDTIGDEGNNCSCWLFYGVDV